jgi:O-acetyl-ADP-ribose deacetylase (regulator of RNase III)
MEIKQKNITFYLCDQNPAMIESWKEYFDEYNSSDTPDNFVFIHDNIVNLLNSMKDKEDITIISPSNSFGDMQGGIDLVYYNYFGYELEELVQKTILEQKAGELLVGDSIIIPIPHYKNMALIVAPTMRVPMNISESVNVYLAFRSILLTLQHTNFKNIIVPGLGTGIGKLSPNISAKQMETAYSNVLNLHRKIYLDIVEETKEHVYMTSE